MYNPAWLVFSDFGLRGKKFQKKKSMQKGKMWKIKDPVNGQVFRDKCKTEAFVNREEDREIQHRRQQKVPTA